MGTAPNRHAPGTPNLAPRPGSAYRRSGPSRPRADGGGAPTGGCLAGARLGVHSQLPRGPDTLTVEPGPIRRSEVGHAPPGSKPFPHCVHGSEAAVMTLVKDRYEVLALLGAGGEARIVKACDR